MANGSEGNGHAVYTESQPARLDVRLSICLAQTKC